MAKCSFVKRRHRKICTGDLDTLITLRNRAIVEPIFNSVDFDEDLDQDPLEVFAKVVTRSGKTVFDGVSTDVNITHEVTIRFESTVTSETWVDLDSKLLNIISLENLEERSEFMLLSCAFRGAGEAAKA